MKSFRLNPEATGRSDVDVQTLLPLTPVVFEILIALAAGERHGYAIMLDVERRRYYRLTPLGAAAARAETEPARNGARKYVECARQGSDSRPRDSEKCSI